MYAASDGTLTEVLSAHETTGGSVWRATSAAMQAKYVFAHRVDHALIDEISGVSVPAEMLLPSGRQQVQLHLGRNLAQEGDFTQVTVSIRKDARVVSVETKPLEGFAEGHAKRDIAEQRLGQRCLANLEHVFTLATNTDQTQVANSENVSEGQRGPARDRRESPGLPSWCNRQTSRVPSLRGSNHS